MTRRSRIALIIASGIASGIAVAVLVLAAWQGIVQVRSTGPGSPGEGSAASRATGDPRSDSLAKSRARSAELPPGALHRDGDVTIAGHVIDIRQQQPVGDVEVVFRSASGETSTTTRADGAYAIQVAAGTYRAFVRDDTVLSVGRPDTTRLPAPPSADAAGSPDEALMTIVVASDDTDNVDLSVVRGGIVSGHVVDRGGRPIAGAVLRARGGDLRPTLATDVAESDGGGSFELRLPAGTFSLDASHPKFAGIAGATAPRITVEPGAHLTTTLTLIAGCAISGHVVTHDGKPAGDGAIEKQWTGEDGDLDFTLAGRIEPDGTFRWMTTDEADVTLRAWPWKSPPSPSRKFTCRDGARWGDVVFQLPDLRPDITGVLVDKAGALVGATFIDLQPLGRGGINQQERTDATGHFEIYHVLPGRYRLTAQAEGHGVATQTIVSPTSGVRLELGGTGRLEGTTTQLTTGSFELLLGTCVNATGSVPLPQSHRVITVTDGHFTIDDLPACELSFGTLWHGQRVPQHASIPSGGTAHVMLDL